MINRSEKLFIGVGTAQLDHKVWPTNIPKVIVANKMDLYNPVEHKVTLQLGSAFAEKKKIVHLTTSTQHPASVYEAFKYLAREYAQLHIPQEEEKDEEEEANQLFKGI